MNETNDILVIIVLYKQLLSDSISYKSLSKNVINLSGKINLYAYDNSPAEFIQEPVQDDCAFNLKYVRDIYNSGVSKAYNEGAKYAHSLNKKWLLLLDQDTNLPNNFLKILTESIREFPRQILFTPRLIEKQLQLSPCKYLFARGFLYKEKMVSGIHQFKGKNMLNSGLCIHLDAFLKSEGYSNIVKLYYSDFVFINRLKKIYSTFVLMDIDVPHSMSSLINDADKQLEIFRLFCIGAREATCEQPKYLLYYFMNTFIRGCLLMLRYKNAAFVVIFYRNYLKKHNA